jgi:hypothetical protein
MPAKGRPRLTPEEYEQRLGAYCERFGVVPVDGLPPFPKGRRETAQHREWVKLYKTRQRLSRRRSGICERCASPASDGSVFCETHRAANSGRMGAHAATADARRAILHAQAGRCPICGDKVDLRHSADHGDDTRELRAVMHPACRQLVGAAESLGPQAVERVRAYLWPPLPRSHRPRG